MSPPATSVADSILKLEKLQTQLASLLPHKDLAVERKQYIQASKIRQILLQDFTRTCSSRSRDSSVNSRTYSKVERAAAFEALADNSKKFPCDNRASRDCTGAFSIQGARKQILNDQNTEAAKLVQLTATNGTSAEAQALVTAFGPGAYR